jgi:ligand-binding sensor domain-containing protein
MKWIISLFVLLLAAEGLAQGSQGFERWKTYTSIADARKVVFQNENTVWVGTSGGLYRYALDTQTLKVFTNTEGLPEVRVSALDISDDKQTVWIGFENGVFTKLDLASETTTSYFDIFNATQAASRIIRDFFISGDTIYVASDFGVSLFIASRRELRESYANFSTLPSGSTPRTVHVFNNQLFVGTSAGTVVADTRNPNLIAPSSWQRFDNSFPTSSILDFNGQVFLGTENGLYRVQGLTAQPVAATLTRAIRSLSKNAQTLFALTGDGFFQVQNNAAVFSAQTSFSSVSSIAARSTGVVITDNVRSLLIQTASGFSVASLNTPLVNRFERLGVDSRGRLWASSSVGSGGAQGVYRLEQTPQGEQWVNFPQLPAAGVQSPVVQFHGFGVRGDDIFLGGWGSGVTRIGANDLAQNFNSSNSSIVQSFAVITEVKDDGNGNVWFTAPLTGPIQLYTFAPSGDIVPIPNTSRATRGGDLFYFDFDSRGRKWISTTERGVSVFDDAGTPANAADDRWFTLSQNGPGSLPSNNVQDIARDNDGVIWLATAVGTAYFFDPASVEEGSVPPAATAFDIRNENLRAVEIDVLNRKWFGSSNGVWLMNRDASSVIRHYTTENSPLVSNRVLSMAYDKRSGKLYIGTDRGLSVLQTVSTEPVPLLNSLKIYPNPYYVPSAQRVVIEGLTRNAFLKIVTPSGRLVRDVRSLGGGVIEWDGKDNNGNDVASGVYLAVVITEDGKQSALGKIAVIRR